MTGEKETVLSEEDNDFGMSREHYELQIAKLNLAVKATKIGLWDMEVITSDPINPSNTFTWSDEFRHMLGYSDKYDFPNVLESWSGKLHPEDKDRVLELFRAHLLDNTGMTPYDVEYRLLKKDGEYAYFRASGETIRDENGNAVRVAGSLMDITETKNTIRDFERQRIEAQAASNAKTAFISTVSHEIRTPLNAIVGITELQLQNNELDENLRESFEKIRISGDMLLGIINDMLDLSKIEAGKLELHKAVYDMESLLSDSAQLNMMYIGDKKIEFDLIVDMNTPAFLMGDELRVKQIISNLLSNAFKYTIKGKVVMSVKAEDCVYTGNRYEHLIICVSDTGQGMTADQLERLFDEFSRFNTKSNRATVGAGLGMSITKKLIQLMGGEIHVESWPGVGSVFTVRLPQLKVDSERIGKENAENLKLFRSNRFSNIKRVQLAREPMPYGKVLIVDDVESNIFVAKALLSQYGLTIDSADSGQKTIDLINAGNVYDIIFMDHMMPEMDGIEVAEILWQMGYSLPIVALTANAVAGQADKFIKLGFEDCILKPIDVKKLNAVLNRLIRDKQPQAVVENAKRQAAEKEIFHTTQPEKTEIAPIFAEVFARDAKKALSVIDEIMENGGPVNSGDMRAYVTNMHGMKSVLTSTNFTNLAAKAQKLENAGRSNDIETILAHTPAFLSALRVYSERIASGIALYEEEASDKDLALLRRKLLLVKNLCKEYDVYAIDSVVSHLREKNWPESISEFLAVISEYTLHSDFEEIIDKVDVFLRDD